LVGVAQANIYGNSGKLVRRSNTSMPGSKSRQYTFRMGLFWLVLRKSVNSKVWQERHAEIHSCKTKMVGAIALKSLKQGVKTTDFSFRSELV
jgi:hypothetical protein